MEKMSKLPNTEFHAMVPVLRQKGFYEHNEIRKINWPAYNKAQTEEAIKAIAFIRDEVDRCSYVNLAHKVGRPLTEPKTLAKAILVAEELQLTERNAEGWMQVLGPYLRIYSWLDDRTIGEAYIRPEVIQILKQVFENNKQSNGELTGDGSGLEKTRKENYESAKKYATYMISIIDTNEIVQEFELGSSNETKVMSTLLDRVNGDSIRLDAGFIDRELVRKIAEKELIPYVFPKSNTLLNGSLVWKSMFLELYYDVMLWLTEYHKRSHSESFHSAFKRRHFSVRKNRELAQFTQVLARIILHNRRRIDYLQRYSA